MSYSPLEIKHSISLYKKYVFHKKYIIENSPQGIKSMWREVITMMQVAIYFYEERKRSLIFLIKNINSFLLENESMPLDKPCNSISMPDIASYSNSKKKSVSLCSLSEEETEDKEDEENDQAGRKATSLRKRRETRKSSNSSEEKASTSYTLKKSVSTFSLSSRSSSTLPSLLSEKNEQEILTTWKSFFVENDLDGNDLGDNKCDDEEKKLKKSKWKRKLLLPFFPELFEKKKKSALSGEDYSEKINTQDILSSWRYKMRRNAICLYHNSQIINTNNVKTLE